MGHTLYDLANTNLMVEDIDCTFVPVVGGVGMKQLSSQNYHSNEIAQSFAKKFHASAVQFFSPAIFNNIEVMKGLREEQPVQEVTALFKRLNAVIMGIGSMDAPSSTLVHSGYISQESYSEFQKKVQLEILCFVFLMKMGIVQNLKTLMIALWVSQIVN